MLFVQRQCAVNSSVRKSAASSRQILALPVKKNVSVRAKTSKQALYPFLARDAIVLLLELLYLQRSS
jgi:hypothetical protein